MTRNTDTEEIRALKHEILEIEMSNILTPFIEDWAAAMQRDPMEDQDELVLAFCKWTAENIDERRKAMGVVAP